MNKVGGYSPEDIDAVLKISTKQLDPESERNLRQAVTLTRKEYQKGMLKELRRKEQTKEVQDLISQVEKGDGSIMGRHRIVVEMALENNVHVPTKTLRDYPDLYTAMVGEPPAAGDKGSLLFSNIMYVLRNLNGWQRLGVVLSILWVVAISGVAFYKLNPRSS